MSFVIGYATKDEAIIAGDGRATDVDGNVVSEDVIKVHRINESVILGFSGNLSKCIEIYSELCENISPDPFLHEKYTVDDAMFQIKRILPYYNDTRDFSFMLGGYNKEWQIVLETITANDDGKVQRYLPKGDDIALVAFSPHGYDGGSVARKIMYENYGKMSPEEFMKMAICEVAKVSQFVNGHVRCESVRTDI